MKRWDILNKLIDKCKYNSYLEVGVQFPRSNFDKVKVDEKISVEPFPKSGIQPTFVGTSDEYFESIDVSVTFDLIFIDGLHHYEQVLKDIDNSLNHLSDGGSILCHDCLPRSKKMQERNDHGGEWTGGVWKAMFYLMSDRSDLDVKIIDTDYGCGLIQRGSQKTKDIDKHSLTFEYFQQNKDRVLNIISTNEFQKWINGQ